MKLLLPNTFKLSNHRLVPVAKRTNLITAFVSHTTPTCKTTLLIPNFSLQLQPHPEFLDTNSLKYREEIWRLLLASTISSLWIVCLLNPAVPIHPSAYACTTHLLQALAPTKIYLIQPFYLCLESALTQFLINREGC